MAETVAFSSPADEKLALELVAKRTQALKTRSAELEQALDDARTALRRGNYSALKEALERVGKSATKCRTCGGNGEICISAGDAIWGEPCPTCGGEAARKVIGEQ